MEKNEPQVTADELLSPRQTEKEPNKQYHPSACASLELERSSGSGRTFRDLRINGTCSMRRRCLI